eukprot:Nk52_evm50s32 gene=Nk52_evmTU50s32
MQKKEVEESENHDTWEDDVIDLTPKKRKGSASSASAESNVNKIKKKKTNPSSSSSSSANPSAIPLENLVRSLSKPQLESLIVTVAKGSPSVTELFYLNAPEPDINDRIEALRSDIVKIKKNKPWTKWGSSRDHFCFKRCKTLVVQMKTTVTNQLKDLTEAEDWGTLFRLAIAQRKELENAEVWDDHADNAQLRQALKNVGTYLKKAYTKGKLANKYTSGDLQQILSRWKHISVDGESGPTSDTAPSFLNDTIRKMKK